MSSQGISFSKLRATRERQGITATQLAKQTGVSRQTIHAVEAGSFVPNTRIALLLGRALHCSVEDLFSLEEETEPALRAELLTNDPPDSNVAQLARLISSPNRQYALPIRNAFNFLPSADGVIRKEGRRGTRVSFSGKNRDAKPATLLIAGCDPALSLLADLANNHGIELLPIAASSRQALRWLSEGKVQIAGSHLLDQTSGEYNKLAIRRLFPKGGVRVVTFSEWETGLLTRPGNPKNIRCIADLASRDVSIVNREKGSGARAQLDTGLKAAGLSGDRIQGYGRIVHGHLPAAFSVVSGWADCCIANSSAARCFGLEFHSLRIERFDLIFPEQILQTKSGDNIVNLLNGSGFRRNLETVAGYETRQTGATAV